MENITEQQSAAIYGGNAETHGVPEASTPPEAASQPEVEQPDAEVEALIAEAEQRGYLRGRNEAAAEMMNRPGMWQPTEPKVTTFLSGLRPGVWDR